MEINPVEDRVLSKQEKSIKSSDAQGIHRLQITLETGCDRT